MLTYNSKGAKLLQRVARESQQRMTIYEALRAKLGREPTNQELKADVQRILSETTIELAEQGKLPHQRKR